MIDPQLYSLFKDFVFEVFPLLNTAIEKRWYKPQYDEYPKLLYSNNGMPSIINDKFSSPYRINDLFRGWSGKADIELEEFDSYKILANYLQNHKEHRECILPENIELHKDKSIFYFMLTNVIEEVLERYYLLNKGKNEDEDLLKEIYLQVEKYIYAEKLYFDLSIPILFLGFEDSEFRINDNITIRRIRDDYQKARFFVRNYSPPISDIVISSATHELVFKNYYKRKGKKYYDNGLSHESVYPIRNFELFFNAIKIITNFNSGFSQILVYPHGWVDFFHMDLPPLKGISLRKYPNYFDDFYWNNEIFPIINSFQIREIGAFYNKLLACEENKIQIANRRLRYSYLRDNEEDSILDIIIALETLLSDNERGELTHKLSLRISILLKTFRDNYNAIDVFKSVKKIYDYRSAVVHGSSKIDSKREIKVGQEALTIKTISVANDYLREIIGILVENPEYLDPKEIDKLLLA